MRILPVGSLSRQFYGNGVFAEKKNDLGVESIFRAGNHLQNKKLAPTQNTIFKHRRKAAI